MQKKIWIYFCLLIFTYGCGTINPENVKYNTAKRQFEYCRGKEAVTLRNNHNQLIDSTNIDEFQFELLEMGYHYPFNERLENDDYLNASDFMLATLYARINSDIQNKVYTRTLKNISELRNISPNIDLYSDCSFLEGYACEKLGIQDSASIAYQNFYTYSDKKYSKLFRGYHYADNKDSKYIAERNYAYHFLRQIPDSLDKDIIHPITPKYYYSSNQPGFTLNPEDFGKNTKYIPSFSLGWSKTNDYSIGFQISSLLNEKADLNLMAYYSRNMSGFGLSVPLQLFKYESNRFGIKLSPFVTFNFIDSMKIDGSCYSLDYHVINWGARISASYFLNQRFWLGTQYLYNFFNEKHKYIGNKAYAAVWYENEFDLSAYYHILKNLNLKVGAKNSGLVAGFYFNGLEISYNFTNPGIILSSNNF